MVELTWEGKYDKDGRRVAPVRIALPFQTVETVNESGQVRAHNLDLWSQGQATEWRNRLIWGDKKYVLPALLPEFAGKVNLIYIDPPFATGADFSFTAMIPDSDESFTKEPSMIEQKAYRDTWGRGLDSYLQWFYETAVLLHELLADDGSIYVHLDWHIAHYAKALMDEVFGSDNIVNEVVWQRLSAHNDAKRYGVIHETIFYYSKSGSRVWNPQATVLSERYIDQFFDSIEEGSGRRYSRADLTANGLRHGETGKPWRGVNPAAKGNHWKVPVAKLDEWDREGRIHWPKSGGVPRLKRYLDEVGTNGGSPQDIWYDVKPIHNQSAELNDYPTQKPEALLDRIIQTSSNEGDLVLDCFCGSGTTAAVAEKLGRRWITCDLGRFAIHTARKRLLSIPNVKPFMVRNLGKYERQAWQVAEFAKGDAKQSAAVQLAYRRFMLELYRAQPLEGHAWLHGLRDGRLVHVGSVDAPVAVGDVQAIVKEFWQLRGQGGTTNGVDVLGWDFAFELNEVAQQMAAEANVQLKFKRIPREVLEKKAVEQGDIRFFELAALSVTVSQRDTETLAGREQAGGRAVTVTLTDFNVPPDDIPDEVRAAVKDWKQWIDYWAVDWDYKGDAFHNMAQTYRTRKNPNTLQTSLAHTYDAPGAYTIVVKVIDLLGNDTTKTVTITVVS